MALTGEELRKRIKGAAELQGYGMRGVRDALEAAEIPKTLAEAMVRGTQPQSQRNIRDLSAVLHVPPEWFTVPDLQEWLANRQPAAWPEDVIEQSAFAEALAELAEVQQRLGHAQELLTPSEPPEESTGSY